MVNDSLRLRLSASDLQKLMPDWPDALINDYIEIFAELEQIILDLNQALADIGTLFDDYENLNADLAGVRGLVALLRAKVNRFGRMLDMLVALVPSIEGDVTNLQQQVASAELAKIRARVVQSVRDYKAWLPAKGVMLRIEGAGASNPVVTNDYNVSSVTRTAPGVYEVTVSQADYFTQNMLTNSVFAHSKIIDPLTSSFDVETVVTGASTFEIRVYEMVVVGAAVQRGAYDLLAGDFIDCQALYSINSTLPPR